MKITKKKAIIIGLVLSLAVLVCDTDAAQKKRSGSLEGIWVPESTIRKLKETMSPVSSSAEMITISLDADHRWKLSWTNFHEGSWRYILEYKKSVLRLSIWESPSPDTSPEGEVRVDASRDKSGAVVAIAFTGAAFIEHQGELFVKIQTEFDMYANELLLSGKWRDENNRSYIFTPDGNARWPDGSFRYEVSMDPSEAGCDYIKIAAKGEPGGYRRYGFKRGQTSLSFYKIVYDLPAPISCEDKPFAELKRVD